MITALRPFFYRVEKVFPPLRWLNQLRFFLYYRIFRPELAAPRAWYRKSDEEDKFQHIGEAVNYLRVAELPLVFFEFGCHSGRTFSSALLAARYQKMDLEAYAFDSFEGLPATQKAEDGCFETGTFYTPVGAFQSIVCKKTKVTLGAHQLIKGFYDRSLTPELKTKLPAKVGFVHIDVDLYSSTITVLEYLKDFFVDGTVVLFDDWYCFPPGQDKGEKKALGEFLRKYPHIRFQEWKNYSTFGKSFFVALDSSL